MTARLDATEAYLKEFDAQVVGVLLGIVLE
jgi:hypothetical protein